MEQNFNEQIPNEQNPEQVQAPYQPQATYEPPYQPQPMYQQPYNPAPAAQPYQPQEPVYPYQPQAAYPYQQPQYSYRAEDVPGLKDLVSSAFSKGLAAVIMAEFPITSIISIFMGSKSKKLVREADQLAAQYGVKAPGKRTAAKILGNIGFGMGIGMTAFWVFYIFYAVVIALAFIAETNYHF